MLTITALPTADPVPEYSQLNTASFAPGTAFGVDARRSMLAPSLYSQLFRLDAPFNQRNRFRIWFRVARWVAVGAAPENAAAVPATDVYFIDLATFAASGQTLTASYNGPQSSNLATVTVTLSSAAAIMEMRVRVFYLNTADANGYNDFPPSNLPVVLRDALQNPDDLNNASWSPDVYDTPGRLFRLATWAADSLDLSLAFAAFTRAQAAASFGLRFYNVGNETDVQWIFERNASPVSDLSIIQDTFIRLRFNSSVPQFYAGVYPAFYLLRVDNETSPGQNFRQGVLLAFTRPAVLGGGGPLYGQPEWNLNDPAGAFKAPSAQIPGTPREFNVTVDKDALVPGARYRIAFLNDHTPTTAPPPVLASQNWFHAATLLSPELGVGTASDPAAVVPERTTIETFTGAFHGYAELMPRERIVSHLQIPTGDYSAARVSPWADALVNLRFRAYMQDDGAGLRYIVRDVTGTWNGSAWTLPAGVSASLLFGATWRFLAEYRLEENNLPAMYQEPITGGSPAATTKTRRILDTPNLFFEWTFTLNQPGPFAPYQDTLVYRQRAFVRADDLTPGIDPTPPDFICDTEPLVGLTICTEEPTPDGASITSLPREHIAFDTVNNTNVAEQTPAVASRPFLPPEADGDVTAHDGYYSGSPSEACTTYGLFAIPALQTREVYSSRHGRGYCLWMEYDAPTPPPDRLHGRFPFIPAYSPGTQGFSAGMWINMPDLPSDGDVAPLLRVETTTAQFPSWALQVQRVAGQLRLLSGYTFVIGDGCIGQSVGVISPNTWTYVAMFRPVGVVLGVGLLLFVNGVAGSIPVADASNPNVTCNGDLAVGADFDSSAPPFNQPQAGSRTYTGLMKNVSYAREGARTVGELLAQFNRTYLDGVSGVPAAFHLADLYCPLDVESGATIPDLSLNANNGALVNYTAPQLALGGGAWQLV